MEYAGRRGALVLATLMLAVVLAGQAAADRLGPAGGRAATVGTVGRTGFAYLTGIRTYLAAALWTRLDPINDGFYSGVPLKDKKFLIPSMRMVTWLDPAFQEAYYDATLLIWENGLRSDAKAVALDGIRNNPDSAWMRMNYAQLLVFEKDYRGAAVEADRAAPLQWTDPSMEFDLLVDAEIAYNKTGQARKAAAVQAVRAGLYEKYGKTRSWPVPGETTGK